MTKKSLSEEAKDLFSSWKSEIEERDADIIARKKKRDEEDAKFNEEFKLALKEVTDDLSVKTKKAVEVLQRNFNGFAEAVKEGTASIYQKLELEKHAAQLSEFLSRMKTKGADKFKNMTDQMKSKLSDYDEELVSEVEVDTLVKRESAELDILIKEAQEEFEKQTERLRHNFYEAETDKRLIFKLVPCMNISLKFTLIILSKLYCHVEI